MKFILFYSSHPQKKKEPPTTLQHPVEYREMPAQADTKTKALPKSAILPTLTVLCCDFNCIFEKRKKRKIKI